MSDTLPDWCEVRRGEAPVLLVAPHGGRRPPIDPCAPPANLRVNDVHTAEITRELGARLGAGWIVNHGLDRNQLDLNRLSQVRRHAAWFLDLLRREVEAIVARCGRAEVLFIHGWNNGQVKCDIGLGGRERDGVLSAPQGASLTVSEDYLRGRVQALRDRCAARGIAAPLGEKYPASHPNNLVRVFASAAADAERGPLLSHSADGAVNALQLELTLPLRCPGAWRERFVECAVEAFGNATATSATTATQRPMRETASADHLHRHGESLQFYDAQADIGLFAGLGRMGPGHLGGRLLLFLGGQRIALFTGEESGADAVPPLRIHRRGHRLALRFDGPILVIEDAAEYLDLEAALAASRTVATEVAVDLEETERADGIATFGLVRGQVEIDGRSARLSTHGFGHVAALRSAGAAQTMLAASFGADRALVGRLDGAGGPSSAVHFHDGAVEALQAPRLAVIEDGDAYTPAGFELHAASIPPLRAEARSRMAILRSGPHGYVRVAFGVARFAWSGLEGHGLYEHGLPLPGLRPA